jgi:hypothetical protein
MTVVACDGCGNYADLPLGVFHHAECRKEAHRRYLAQPRQETRTPRPAPALQTVSVREGFTALGDQSLSPDDSSRRNGEREAEMLARLVLGPRRTERTSPRDHH